MASSERAARRPVGGAEVGNLVPAGWVRTGENIILRRGKPGLDVPPGTSERFSVHFGSSRSDEPE